jgi:arylsulfatase A-like enzyme
MRRETSMQALSILRGGILAILLSICTSLGSTALATPSRQPNIVFVLLDDVRYDDLVNHPFVQLPNLARLVREGASFQRFYTSAPLCSPSRAVFMTGQYPHRNGIIDNGERAEQSHQIVTFPRLLHDAGYRTGFFGKWHMGHADDTARPGFDKWVSFVGQGVYFNPMLNVDGTTVRATGYMTDVLTDHAISFIEASPADEPFLAFIAQKASHPEVHPNQVRTFPSAPGDERLYEGAEIPRAPNWQAPVQDKPALARPVDYNDPRSPKGGLPDAIIRDRLRMLRAVDRSIGRLFETLSRKGVLDQTIFVVTSDQGFFYGEFGLAQERRLAYEPSIRIPLLIRYPAISRAGTRPSALVSNVDVAPTLLELAGVRAPANLDGRSFVGVLRRPSANFRNEFLIEYHTDREFPRIQNMGYNAIRTDRYKYIRYTELSGMDELYDLRSDPYEMNNLLPTLSSGRTLVELKKKLDRLVASKPAKVEAVSGQNVGHVAHQH